MTIGNYVFVDAEEENELRAQFEYSDADLQLLNEGRSMMKAGEELVARAAHDAICRRKPNGPSPALKDDE